MGRGVCARAKRRFKAPALAAAYTNDTARRAAERPSIRSTAKPVSGWCGLLLVFRYLRGRGMRELLAGVLPDGRASPEPDPGGHDGAHR